MYTVTKESVVDYLCHSLQEGCLDSVSCLGTAFPVDLFRDCGGLPRNTLSSHADSQGSRHCCDSLLVDRCDYQNREHADEGES